MFEQFSERSVTIYINCVNLSTFELRAEKTFRSLQTFNPEDGTDVQHKTPDTNSKPQWRSNKHLEGSWCSLLIGRPVMTNKAEVNTVQNAIKLLGRLTFCVRN